MLLHIFGSIQIICIYPNNIFTFVFTSTVQYLAWIQYCKFVNRKLITHLLPVCAMHCRTDMKVLRQPDVGVQ